MHYLPLRHELYLLAHDEDRSDFRPWVNLPALGIALTGAALIDLLIGGWIRIDGQHIRPRKPQILWTGDPATDQILYTVRTSPSRPTVTEVLRRHSADMYQRITTALVEAGVLQRVPRRLRGWRHQPVDPMVVPRARGGPRHAVEHPDSSDLHADALCALIRSTGLESILYLSLPGAELRARLDDITLRIPDRADDPHLHAIPAITAAVATAIGDLAVAVYR